MAKALVVNHEKCNGCRKCEEVCSARHGGVANPLSSRIRIMEWQPEGVFMPVVCHQCEDAPCIAACPTMARVRDEETGKTSVDYERCISCKTCVAVCPFGASRYDPLSKRVVTCDLCDGDPQCVKACETGAITCLEKGDISKVRQYEAALKLYGAADRALRGKMART